MSKNVSVGPISKYFPIICGPPSIMSRCFNISFCSVWKSRVKKFLHRLQERMNYVLLACSVEPKSFYNFTRHLCKKPVQTITERCSHALPFSPVGWPCREEAFPMVILNIQSHQGGHSWAQSIPFTPGASLLWLFVTPLLLPLPSGSQMFLKKKGHRASRTLRRQAYQIGEHCF